MAEWLRRYVQVVVNFVGVGSSPTGCKLFLVLKRAGIKQNYAVQEASNTRKKEVNN